MHPIFYHSGVYSNCKDAVILGQTTSGVYTIKPDHQSAFQVYCDMDTDGGGWTVFQHREDGSVDFYRNWSDYQQGFGNLSGKFLCQNLFIVWNCLVFQRLWSLNDLQLTSWVFKSALFPRSVHSWPPQPTSLSWKTKAQGTGGSWTSQPQTRTALAWQDGDTLASLGRRVIWTWHWPSLVKLVWHSQLPMMSPWQQQRPTWLLWVCCRASILVH